MWRERDGERKGDLPGVQRKRIFALKRPGEYVQTHIKETHFGRISSICKKEKCGRLGCAGST